MMGKLSIFEICFANLTGVYYAGQIVEGQVTVELTQPMSLRGIRINFKGKAHVSWKENKTKGTGDDRRTVTKWYTASENYFDHEVLLFGIWPKQGNNTEDLAAGRHTFPFQFQLPLQLPSSFEDSIGFVRYTINCKIDKPWKFDHNTKRPFTVVGVLDLNQTPSAAFKTFHATSKSRTDRQVVAKITRPSIPAHSEDVWNGEKLIIPPLPPSYLQGCKIIDIQYILMLNVDPSGPSFDLEVPLEIIIGTIPLRFVVERNPPMPPPPLVFDNLYQWNLTPSAPPPEVLYPLPPGNEPSSPPPSYMECITGQHSIRDEDDNEYVKGQLNYAPVYPYYNWGYTSGSLPS